MRTFSRRAALVLSCLVPACASPPPKEPAVPPAVVVAPPEPTPPAGPDLSPVDEPGSLVVVARWKGPIKNVDQALKVLGVPLSVESLLALEEPDIVRILNLDASVDLAVALDPASTDDEPKFLAAVSIPLTGIDAAREPLAKEGRFTEIRPGVLRRSQKRGEKDVCDLAMAAGDAPARLVCGPGEQDVEALRAWLVRGLPRTPPDTGDLVATLRLAPLKARYLGPLRTKAIQLGDQARTGLTTQGITDVDLLTAPAAVLDEGIKLLDDVDRIDIRTSFTSTPPELAAGGTVRFGGQSSWFTRALTEANDHAGPPPAMFWRVPADAYSATWGRGSDPHLYDGVRKVFHKVLAEVLARVPFDAADKDAIAAFVDAVPRSPGSWVSAQGVLKTAAKPPAGKGAAGRTVADARAFFSDALGWHVAGIEAPAPEYVAWAKAGLALYDRAAAFVRRTAGGAKRGDASHALAFVPRITLVNAPPGWPRGTVALDVVASYDDEIASIFLPHKKGSDDEPAKKKGPKVLGSITFRLAIVPDGDLTWIGFSADLDALKKHMVAVMPGAPAAGTLASREGLATLKRPGQTWGGFFSVGELLERAVTEAVKEKPEHADEVKAALAAMPNKGKTPVLFIGSGAAGPKPSSAVEVRIQQGSLADLAALAAFFMSPKGREIWKKID